MDYDLRKEEEDIRSLALGICRNHVAPGAGLLDQKPGPELRDQLIENMIRLAETGVFLPPDEGAGPAPLSLSILLEETAYACPSTALALITSSVAVGGQIRTYGSRIQKKQWLAGLETCTDRGCFALTENSSGFQPGDIKTLARKTGGGWILDGAKRFVALSPLADFVLLFAGTEAGISSFLVNMNNPGVIRGDPEKTLGFRGAEVSRLNFEKCVVSDDALLGDPGRGLEQWDNLSPERDRAMAALSLGIIGRSLDLAVRYARERESLGKPLNRYQEVSFKLSEIYIKKDITRLLLYRACWTAETGHPEESLLASSARLFGGEAARECPDRALQVFGARGTKQGEEIERLFRDGRMCEIVGGTSENHRLTIAGEILERYRP